MLGERVGTGLGPRALKMGGRGGCVERRGAQTQQDLLPEVESSSPLRARDPCIQILDIYEVARLWDCKLELCFLTNVFPILSP